MLASASEVFEVAERVQATCHGGIGVVHRLVRQLGLPKPIDNDVTVFRGRSPYRVSDHVLALDDNVVAGGRTLDDLELRRQDNAFMDALGAARLPDPTTASDFLRRFERRHIDELAEAINEARALVWSKHDAAFLRRGVIDRRWHDLCDER